MQVAQGRYDEVLCLGDLVGYGPDPNPVVDRIRSIAKVVIRGNHDKACCGLTDAEDFNPLARLATLWTRHELTLEHLNFLRNLPSGPFTIDGFEVVHGSPNDEDEYLFDAGGALEALRHLQIQTVLFGHTHYQGGFLLTAKGQLKAIHNTSHEDGCTLSLPIEDGTRYLINPGSVGQPRDGDWRAAFAIVDNIQRKVEYYRTSYDLSITQTKMQKAGLPEPLIKRLEVGR